MGSARLHQESVDLAEEERQKELLAERTQQMLRKHANLQAQIAALQAEIEQDQGALESDRAAAVKRRKRGETLRREIGRRKGAETSAANGENKSGKRKGRAAIDDLT